MITATAADAGVRLDGLLAIVRRRFAEAAVDTPDVDARVLVGGLLGLDATAIVLRYDMVVEPADRERVEAAVARRVAGEPVYRILGVRPFFGLDLGLSPATLEPRPDTEILVEALLPIAAGFAAKTGRCRIADLGTGTGAIALALLSQVAAATAVGSDISCEALSVARENARCAGFSDRFETLESDWWTNFSGRFDIIVSNPPYIRTEELGELQREVRLHDPSSALDGGSDGLSPFRTIAGAASGFLRPGGVIGVEYGHDQRSSVKAIFVQAGYRSVSDHDDLAGHARASLFCHPAG